MYVSTFSLAFFPFLDLDVVHSYSFLSPSRVSHSLYVVHPLSKRWGWELTPGRRIVLSTLAAAIGVMIGGILEIARKNAPVALDAAGQPLLNSDGLPVHNISLLWQILIFNFTSLMQGLAWPAGGEYALVLYLRV